MSCPRALAIYGTIARFLDRKEVAGLHTHKTSRAGFARAPTSCFAGSNPPARCEQTARPKFVDLMGFGHCLSKATSGIAVAAKPLRSNTTEHGVDSLRLYLRLAEREIAGRFGCVRYRQAVGAGWQLSPEKMFFTAKCEMPMAQRWCRARSTNGLTRPTIWTWAGTIGSCATADAGLHPSPVSAKIALPA